MTCGQNHDFCNEKIGGGMPVDMATTASSSGNPRCLHCNAFVDSSGACHNYLCPSRRNGPPGVPSVVNNWRWGRPPGKSPGDEFREQYDIPLRAIVKVSKAPDGRYLLTWHDPKKPYGYNYGTEQDAWVENSADIASIKGWLKEPGQTGFIDLDNGDWNAAHPTLINPLIDAPGIDHREVERIEQELLAAPEPDKTPLGEARFTAPATWQAWDPREKYRKDIKNQRRADILARFRTKRFRRPAIDGYYDFTHASGNWEYRHETPLTVRQFAALRFNLWGFEEGHDMEAIRLANLCGVTLIAEDTCPVKPPAAGEGNAAYLFDYSVDGMPAAAFGLDLNTHEMYMWPDDGRQHKNGWDYMGVLIGHERFQHNVQNYAVVQLTGGEKRTRRNSDLYVQVADRKNIDHARAGVGVIAALMLRTGHDPQAKIYYNSEGRQVSITVGEAARGHQARPAPPSLGITEAGHHMLNDVVPIYTRWRDIKPSQAQMGQAKKQLGRAARRLAGLMKQAGLVDPALSQQILEFAENVAYLDQPVVEFILLKQAVHNLIREPANRKRVESVYGAGFIDRFGA